jgi:hypothetical protein
MAKEKPVVVFPAEVWKKAHTKEDLAAWLDRYLQDDEPQPVLVFKDMLPVAGVEVPVEIQVFANGDILALLPDTDLAAEGSDLEQAKVNLLRTIEDDYAYLFKRRDLLNQHLTGQLHRLENLFGDAHR